MKKVIVGSLVVTLLGIFAGSANAQTMQGGGRDIQHAYQPYVVSQTGWMRARANNMAKDPQSNLICVEAFRKGTGAKTHLGCLTVNWWAESLAMGNPGIWAKEFNAPTNWLSPGTYTVVYTYRDRNGNWHSVRSMDNQVLNGTITK